jgi:hypothetical protein
MPFTGDIYSLSQIKKYTLSLLKEAEQHSVRNNSEQFLPLSQLEVALTQFFEISEKIDQQPELLLAKGSDFSSISELGDYGIQLLASLEQWCEAGQLDNERHVQLSILSLAVWIHNHNGVLQQLESVVNALSLIANQIQQPAHLIKLHKITEKITNSAHERIKADLDKSEAGRPWRILNLNHGIIVTRTHNTAIMNSVFELLVQRLPDDAANFFADGMKQMDIIGYPEHVKQVMQQFYRLTNKPTLH